MVMDVGEGVLEMGIVRRIALENERNRERSSNLSVI